MQRATVRFQNVGRHYETWEAGFTGPVLLHGLDQGQKDLTRNKCSYKIGSIFYPCSFLVLDSPNMEFLIGLDMLRKHYVNYCLLCNNLLSENSLGSHGQPMHLRQHALTCHRLALLF
ncbi:hypothetical protein GLYMA_10G116100v4 [Glycine max]|uniref:Aspartic peptidase DDI1-type domain-containing protein n=1 Tax=Glycine max TaxID=3847 RepID=K7LIS0_SOYBN|nr:hypothetical protein GLYMA_10G116100v4 [Glycine max]